MDNLQQYDSYNGRTDIPPLGADNQQFNELSPQEEYKRRMSEMSNPYGDEEDEDMDEEEEKPRKKKSSSDTKINLTNKQKIAIVGGVAALFLIVILAVVLRGAFTGGSSPLEEQGDLSFEPVEEDLIFDTPVDTGDKEAEEKRKAEQEERERKREEARKVDLEKYFELKKEAWEMGSDAYRELLELTYLGLPDVAYIPTTKDFESSVTKTFEANLVYFKLPLKGKQAYVKLMSYSGEVIFYEVPIQRYITLNKKGNMKITGQVTILKDGTQFFSNIQEVR